MATSDIVISFKDMNGNSATCMRVVISDGTTVLEFNNVTSISETVPSNASYRFVWQSAGYDTMDQISLALDENESYSFNFYCLDRSVVVQHERPYILLEEVGANADLTWSWNDEDKVLDFTVSGAQGKRVECVVWVDTDFGDEPKWASSYPQRWPRPQTWSLCLPPNANLDMDKPVGATDIAYRINFHEIDSEHQFTGFRKGTYKGFIIDTADGEPLQSVLKDSNNNIIAPEFLWPQYSVGEGYYSMVPTQIPNAYVSLTLPLKIELDKASMYELYPPKVTELAEYTFDIAAEYYHTRAGVSSVNHNAPQQTVTAYVVVNGYDQYVIGYFGYFALPRGTLATEIMVTLTDSTEITLSETQDYILTQTALFNLYCVRVPIDAESVKLSY